MPPGTGLALKIENLICGTERVHCLPCLPDKVLVGQASDDVIMSRSDAIGYGLKNTSQRFVTDPG